jgi:hypothetical protein
MGEGDDAVVCAPVPAGGENDFAFAIESVGGDDGNVGSFAGIERKRIALSSDTPIREIARQIAGKIVDLAGENFRHLQSSGGVLDEILEAFGFHFLGN